MVDLLCSGFRPRVREQAPGCASVLHARRPELRPDWNTVGTHPPLRPEYGGVRERVAVSVRTPELPANQPISRRVIRNSAMKGSAVRIRASAPLSKPFLGLIRFQNGCKAESLRQVEAIDPDRVDCRPRRAARCTESTDIAALVPGRDWSEARSRGPRGPDSPSVLLVLQRRVAILSIEEFRMELSATLDFRASTHVQVEAPEGAGAT